MVSFKHLVPAIAISGIFLLVLLLLPGSVLAGISKPQANGFNATLSPDGVSISNGYYSVTVGGPSDLYPGAYTVSTGPLHTNPNENIFYGGVSQFPATTYNSVRFYESHVEYTLDSTHPSENYTQVDINDFLVGVTGSGNQVVATWNITDEHAVVTQVIAIEGNSLSDSRVRVTMNVHLDDSGPLDLVHIGLRYLWDYEIGGTDDAVFRTRDPHSGWINVETDYVPPGSNSYEVTDSLSHPVFSAFGSVKNGNFMVPVTSPDRLALVQWTNVVSSAFDYSISGAAISDSALLYYWGDHSPGLPLYSGQTLSVTEYVFTGSSPPAITTLPATGIGNSFVTLNGTLLDTGAALFASAGYEWGDLAGGPYRNRTQMQELAALGNFSFGLSGLPPGTYFYRAIAVAAGGTGHGRELYFQVSGPRKADLSSGGITGAAPPGISVKSVLVDLVSYTNQPVSIIANISNSGDIPGTYSAALKINGQVKEQKNGIVLARAAVPVKFSFIPHQAGQYKVEVNGRTAGFTVLEASQGNKVDVYLPLLLVFAVIAIADLMMVLILRRRRGIGRGY